MFALAALLSVSSIGWPLIQTRIPAINDALQAAASSRIGWFFVGIIPAFVGGMLLSDSLRRRREITRLPSKWLPIFKAMETLARQDLLDRYQYVGKQISDILDERLPLERRLTELETPGPIVSALERSEIAQEYARLSAQRDATRKNRRKSIQTAENCSEALRSNIEAQLRKGDLLAKGFFAPHRPGALEKIIPTEEWRFLSLDDTGNQALGPNFEYIAVLIGKPGR